MLKCQLDSLLNQKSHCRKLPHPRFWLSRDGVGPENLHFCGSLRWWWSRAEGLHMWFPLPLRSCSLCFLRTSVPGVLFYLSLPTFPIFERSLQLTLALDEVRHTTTALLGFPGTIMWTVGEQVFLFCCTEVRNVGACLPCLLICPQMPK